MNSACWHVPKTTMLASIHGLGQVSTARAMAAAINAAVWAIASRERQVDRRVSGASSSGASNRRACALRAPRLRRSSRNSSPLRSATPWLLDQLDQLLAEVAA